MAMAGPLSESSVDVTGKVSTSLRTLRPKTEPLWRTHDAKANKHGQRGTIYWVGKNIVGEDGSLTGERCKGASYHGEWGGNKKNGYGVQVFPNGEKYEGQWGNGLRNGEGTLWVPVGQGKKLRKLYVGGWRDDKRHGRGTCFFKNGQFFQGSWDHGKMHGHGTLRYANGDLYIGQWHEGLRSGQGTLNAANGDCYEGYWLNDEREGTGSHFYAESGKVFVGEWAAGLPKAGVYTQASANPEQATGVPTTSVLPPLRLALPSDVLEGALAVVRQHRKSYRVQSTPMERLFAEEEVAALRAAFEGATRGNPSGLAKIREVQVLCADLGTEVSLGRLQRLMAEAAVQSEEEISLAEFLRVIALLIDEESAAQPDMSMGIDGEMGYDASRDYLDDPYGPDSEDALSQDEYR